MPAGRGVPALAAICCPALLISARLGELGARQRDWERDSIGDGGMGTAGEGLLGAPASGQGPPVKRRRLSRSAGG